MQFGPGTTITHTPTSPAGTPYPGVVDAQGNVVISPGTYSPDGVKPTLYRWQDSNGDWFGYIYTHEDRYDKYYWDKQIMKQIHVETGTWSAVA